MSPRRWSSLRFTLLVCTAMPLMAQEAESPLTFQGMHQWVPVDVRGRGMGGAVTASASSATALFSNPAALTRLTGGEFRVGGVAFLNAQRQYQEWVPNRQYTAISILMEDKWEGIKEPLVFDKVDSTWKPPASPFDRLQKPFDTIGPNWSRKTNRTLPLSVAAAMPFEFEEMKVVFGLGGAQAVDLEHYYQNNNVLNPLIGAYRPQPMGGVKDLDTLRVRWYQHVRKREGVIYNVSPALALKYGAFSIALSGSYLFGKSDDLEQRRDRGLLTFNYQGFKIDSLYYRETSAGTSTYKGTGAVLGLLWEGPRFSVGATIASPISIKRTYDRSFTIDTAATSTIVQQSGNEELRMPLRYTVGVVLTPTKRWMISLDYGITGFPDARQVRADGKDTAAWLGGNTWKIGAEYLAGDWIALRGGYREEVQPFAAAGSPILDDAVKAAVLSLGLGVRVADVSIDAAYEYYALDYKDVWQSNVNGNLTEQHRLLLEFGYHF